MKTVKPGIRLKPNGKYLATKSIDSKRYYQEFETPSKAAAWKRDFHPLLSPTVSQIQNHTVPDQSNGRDFVITFKTVVERYRNGRMKTNSTGRQYKKGKRMDRFLPPLYSVRMCEMFPEVITRVLEDAKLAVDTTYGRSNFNEELKDLKAIFNWYKEEVDISFNSPVTKYHKAVGKVKDIDHRDKYLSEEQLLRFIDHLDEPYQSMAVIQFCLALRIGEVAALNTQTVNFKAKTVSLTEVITWIKDVPYPKKTTKTEDKSTVQMNDEIYRRLMALNLDRPKGCKYFFHFKGGAMKYNYINLAYNKGLKKAGLTEFSGTHLVRHTMGTLTRRKNGLDAAQAILRHTTSRMAEHYAKLDVNDKVSSVVIEAGEIFSRGRATVASGEREKLENLGS